MIVMKFGGTSVADAAAIGRVIRIVRGRLAQKPVVVLSAMARITDQLQTMGRAAASDDLESALSLSGALRGRHHATATDLMPRSAYEQLRPVLDAHFRQLDDLLRGIAAVRELSPRTTDYVLSFGERLSSLIVTAAMKASGIKAVHVDARNCIVTDAQHTHAVPDFAETDAKVAVLVGPLLEQGRVPVMGGFIAATREGVTTTIGRGGSDFSAAIVGAALDAKCIEIWTDVDGIKTTDPNLCPDARRLAEVSFEEAAEMAFFGAKVLHPATLVPAMRKNIPVMVLNSMNPRSSGTCVRARTERPRGKFTAIAAKKNISILNVAAPRMLVSHGFLHDVFEVFKRRQLPVDIVASSEVSLSLTVDSRIDISGLLAELRDFTDVQVVTGKAIIAVVGENLRNRPGMLAYMFSAISDINVCMISQGASEITLSFVIDEKDVPEAVRNLHHLLFPRSRKTAPQSELPTGVAAGISRGSAGVESLVFSTGEVEDIALSEVAD